MPEETSPTPLTEARPGTTVEDLVPEWGEALGRLREDTERSVEEVASLRRELGAALMEVRQARFWDEARSGEAVARLTSALEEGQRRLADRAARLATDRARALATASSTTLRLAMAMDRLSLPEGPAIAPSDLAETIRAVVAAEVATASQALTHRVVKGLQQVEERLADAAAAGPEDGDVGAAAAAGVDGLRTAFEEMRASVLETAEGWPRLAGDLAELRREQDALRQAVEAVGAALDQTQRRTGELVEGPLSDRLGQLGDDLVRLGERLASLEEKLTHDVGTLMGGLEERLADRQGQVGPAVEALQDQFGLAREETASRLVAFEERLGGRIDQASEAWGTALAEVARDLAEVREELAAPRDAARVEPVVEAVEALRVSLEGTTAAVASQGSDLAEARDRDQEQTRLIEALAEAHRDTVAGLDERIGVAVEPRVRAVHDALTEAVARAQEGVVAAVGALHGTLDATAERLRGDVGAMEIRLGALVEERLSGTAEQIDSLAGQVAEGRRRADEVATSVTERLDGLHRSLREDLIGVARQLAKRQEEAEERASVRIQEVVEGLHASVDDLRRAVREGLAEADASSAARLAEATEATSARLDVLEAAGAGRNRDAEERARAVRGALAGLAEATQVGRRNLDAAVVAMRQGLGSLQARMDEAISALRHELEAERDRMASATARVDHLAETIESLGERRAFQKLAHAERALAEGQAEFTERLAASSERLSSTVQDIESRIGRAIAAAAREAADPELPATVRRLAASLGALQEQLPAAMAAVTAEDRRRIEALERSMAGSVAGLEERLTAVQSAVADSLDGAEARLRRAAGAPAGKSLAAATASLRKEVEALRRRIEGWGKPRTAPRLAQEVADLGARFDALERAVQDTLAATVARRVQASLDRRLRAMLAELPAPGQQTDGPPPARRRRGGVTGRRSRG